MAVIPEPKLAPESMPWGREITKRLNELDKRSQSNEVNSRALQQQVASAATQSETITETVNNIEAGNSTVNAVLQAPPNLEVASLTGGWTIGGAPYAEAVLTWDSLTKDVNLNDLGIAAYEILVGIDGTEPSIFGTVPYVPAGDPLTELPPVQTFTLTGLLPSHAYTATVRGISVYGMPGEKATPVAFTTAAAPDVLVAPSPPSLETGRGLVIAAWDGLDINGETPVPGFSYVYGEWTTEGTEDYTPFGAAITHGGEVNLAGRPIGSTVYVRFRAVDRLNRVSDPSDSASIVVVGVEGPDIEANTILANNIAAGAIEVTHLSAGIGNELDISANASINLLVGGVGAINDNLDEMQTYYRFGADEATISTPSSAFSLALAPTGIEIREGTNKVSWWDAGQMYVKSFVGEIVVLGNHQLEKYGTGTVVRKIN